MGDRLRSLAATPHALPVDRLAAIYLALTGVIAGLSMSTTGFLFVALHIVALGVVHMIARVPVPTNPFAAFIRLAWPVVVTPLLYMELATLNQLLFPGYFDATVQAWEQALFGAQLSMVSSSWLDALWFSELLHFGYVSYYLVVPVALIGGFKLGGEAGLQRVAFTTAFAFFLCYLCFAVFPVAGPRYEFARIVGPQTEGAIYGLVHTILEGGSSKGTAFPSSHVAATVSAWLAAGLVSSRLMWGLAPFAILLTLGTVYGRFHYGIDSLVGLGVALVAVWTTPYLMKKLGDSAREDGNAS